MKRSIYTIRYWYYPVRICFLLQHIDTKTDIVRLLNLLSIFDKVEYAYHLNIERILLIMTLILKEKLYQFK